MKNKPFVEYFKAIKGLDPSESTELTLRKPLDDLLNALASSDKLRCQIIHEPKRHGELGAPDFKIKSQEAIIGYLETKKTDENLDAILQSEQIIKYKKLSGNIILTNYLEFIWLKEDSIAGRETLCYSSDVGSRRAKLDNDKADKVAKLISGFLSTPPQNLAKTKDLAEALAVRCHTLRDFLLEELERQKREDQQGRLHGLYDEFQKNVFNELKLKEFADAFAQTLGYGLFLAKLNVETTDEITLKNAKNYVPGNFKLIRELMDFLKELNREEYSDIKWLIEEILSIMNTLDTSAIHESLAFTERRGRFPNEEDDLLFSRDPYVYFYEDFLKAYDKDIREARGVYYTPPPVVNFIIRSVNDILKNTFDIQEGLADDKEPVKYFV